MKNIERRTALKIMGGALLAPMIPVPFTQAKETSENFSPFVSECRILIDAHHEWVVKRTKDAEHILGIGNTGKHESELNFYSIKHGWNKPEMTFLPRIGEWAESEFTSLKEGVEEIVVFSEPTLGYHVTIQRHQATLPRIEIINLEDNTYLECVANVPGVDFSEFSHQYENGRIGYKFRQIRYPYHEWTSHVTRKSLPDSNLLAQFELRKFRYLDDNISKYKELS